MVIEASEGKSCISGTVRQFFVTTVVTIGIFGLGTVLAWTSPALPELSLVNPFGAAPLTLEENSWIGSIAMLGALAACPIAGFSVDFLGRRNSMLIFSIPFLLGWILIASSTQLHTLLIGRFITGFCGGAFSLAAPVYISETANNDIRGTLASLFQLMLVLGILFTYVVGSFVSWRSLAYISGVIPGISFLLLPFIPASPRYLLRRGKATEARKSLRWLRNIQDVNSVEIETELFEIEKGLEVEAGTAEEKTKLRDLLKTNWHLLKPLAICLSLMIFEQVSGYNAIIFYTGGIFQAAGTTLGSNVSSIIVGVVQVVATIVSSVLVDRAGRRALLLFSQAVMAVSLLALGIFFVLKEEVGDHSAVVYLKWLPLASMLVFIIAFSIGIGPLSWTMMGEILPPNVKGVSSSIATSLVWLCGFIVTKTFDDIAEALGISWCFFIFCICCVGGFVSIYFTVPETKGKSLEEIQDLFKPNLSNPSLSNHLS